MKPIVNVMVVLVVLVAIVFTLITNVQASETTKPPSTVTPSTRLPVSSTPVGQTTYAKDHAHASSPTKHGSTTATATATANKAVGTEPTVKSTGAAANATTSKPTNMTTEHVVLKQKLNTIAVKCKDELHAPQEIMALVSNTVVPQNEQQRCYLECVYKNLNLVKNNKFSVPDGKTLAQIRFANHPDEHKKAVAIIETCEKEAIIDPKTTEKCAAGRVIRNCFVKNGEKINFFPKA